MTSTDVAVRETHQTTVLSNEQLSTISRTEFVPRDLRGNLPAILACVATGRALGIDDMTAIRSIHVIDGRATFSAELMVQLVRRAGHSITGEFTDGSSTVVGTRADNGDTMTVTWTMQMAERAGLAGKSNWRKYPESMLWARAVSQLCRMLFPDCFAGSTYTPEEMGDEGLSEPDAVRGPSGGHDTAATPSPIGDDGGPSGSLSSSTPSEPEVDDSGASHDAGDQTASGSESVEDDGKFPPPGVPQGVTEKQAGLLNMLVGRLRDAGHISTENLYRALGRPLPGGELHWAPLRDTLTKAEASELIERLTALEKKVTIEPESDFARGAREAQANRQETIS